LTDEDGYGQPYLQIFSSCRYLLREMESIQCDKNSIEIADSRMADHAIDALRYGLNSDLYRRREAKNTAPVRAYKKQREPYDPTKRGCWAGGGAG
jgi:hypothetical protein